MKKADRCQKKLSLNQCNFLPSCLWPEGPFRVFQHVWFLYEILSALRYTVNHNAHGGAEIVREREGCGGLYICLSASMRLLMFFLDQETGLKI